MVYKNHRYVVYSSFIVDTDNNRHKFECHKKKHVLVTFLVSVYK